MLKTSLLAISLAGISVSSFAQIVAGVNYTHIASEPDGVNLNFNTLGISIGYQHNLANNFSIIPELRLGVGIGDDTVIVDTPTATNVSVDVEVDHLVTLAVRGQYHHSNDLYFFSNASYSNVELTATTTNVSVTKDDWEFGLGLGLGYQFHNALAAEVFYEAYDDDSEFIGIGIKYYLSKQ